MTIAELVLLALSLCFDTFAVSLSGGLSLQNISNARRATIVASFAFFQAGLLLSGNIFGALLNNYLPLQEYDHWIAFSILLYIGVRMIMESFGDGTSAKKIDLLNTKTLITLSIATSIDAIAVGTGLQFAEISAQDCALLVFFTLIATALASLAGLFSGNKIGSRIGKKASIVGGLLLILIGVRILLEHLF